ncbi:MAG: DUF3943 domain-containing protein [Bacteroidetes bacterium]|nr:MAG: DUF3943 domain-containing protein [Bacteroidota bacterium]
MIYYPATLMFMKTIFTILFLVMLSFSSFAQQAADTVKIDSDLYSDTIKFLPDSVDKRPRNIYGHLLNDDPLYNRKYAWPIPLLRVTTANLFNWATSRYVFRFDWARISVQNWKDNLKYGWEWDNDRFGVNFIGHPHTGSTYFNVARSNGYSFWATYPYTIAGSFMWEYFGENTRPSKNDLINTPISGAFLGEVLYRISSTILDDRKRGAERVWREIFAGLINPTRALNRFTQNKMWRVTKVDVYQQEPLNITLSIGAHRVNENNKFGTGASNAIANLQLDYGDPFELRRRKPFDVFRLKLEGRYGDDKKIVDNVLGYGFLFGKSFEKENYGMLAGIFQHFDYWNNKVFEVGTLGFGPGIISKIKFGRNSTLYSSLHFAGVPIAGNSTRVGPDTSEFRNYPFGGGWEGKIEERFDLSKLISIGFSGYYYWIFNYEGSPGKSHIGILKPMINIRLINNLRLGFEHHIYYDNRFINDLGSLNLERTEQKIYLQYFFGDRN